MSYFQGTYKMESVDMILPKNTRCPCCTTIVTENERVYKKYRDVYYENPDVWEQAKEPTLDDLAERYQQHSLTIDEVCPVCHARLFYKYKFTKIRDKEFTYRVRDNVSEPLYVDGEYLYLSQKKTINKTTYAFTLDSAFVAITEFSEKPPIQCWYDIGYRGWYSEEEIAIQKKVSRSIRTF